MITKIEIDEKLTLELIDEEHAEALFELVDTNREHLRKFLPWVDPMVSVNSMRSHIADCKRREAEQTDFAYVIMYEGKPAGRIGIHYIHNHNRIASIGYWLAAGTQGKGIMTRACAAMVDRCFDTLHMNRVEIKCATENKKSRAIAERLYFKQEAVLRQAELVNGVFVDLFLFSMLRSEWDQCKKKLSRNLHQPSV